MDSPFLAALLPAPWGGCGGTSSSQATAPGLGFGSQAAGVLEQLRRLVLDRGVNGIAEELQALAASASAAAAKARTISSLLKETQHNSTCSAIEHWVEWETGAGGGRRHPVFSGWHPELDVDAAQAPCTYMKCAHDDVRRDVWHMLAPHRPRARSFWSPLHHQRQMQLHAVRCDARCSATCRTGLQACHLMSSAVQQN